MYKIIGVDGNQYGPVSLDELKSWIRERRANGDTLVLLEGTADWRPMKTFPELASELGISAAPQPLGTATSTPTPLQPQYSGEPVSDYLIPSILVTLCCCLPFGIAAIVYAAQANSKKSIGDIAGARQSAEKAKMWMWLAFGLGIVVNIIAGIIQFALIAGKH